MSVADREETWRDSSGMKINTSSRFDLTLQCTQRSVEHVAC